MNTHQEPVRRVADLPRLAGHVFQPTDWLTLDQSLIDRFADCTGDRQFIHVDPARARAETPFGGTIAHGFLALALTAGHPAPDFPVLEDLALALNYGLDRVRFLQPVPSGSRVRLRSHVVDVEAREAGRMLLRQETSLEIEGLAKPGFVAVQLALFIPLP
jgi:acyl dehydratase